MTNNRCYQQAEKIVPKKIMVHSTGTPQPDPYAYINYWNKYESSVCVHGFVHQGGVIQTLPWNYRAWHAGGIANKTSIGFEICEPSGFKYGQGATMIDYDVEAQQSLFQ